MPRKKMTPAETPVTKVKAYKKRSAPITLETLPDVFSKLSSAGLSIVSVSLQSDGKSSHIEVVARHFQREAPPVDECCSSMYPVEAVPEDAAEGEVDQTLSEAEPSDS